MRIKPIFVRNSASIVQQTNVITVRDVIKQLASGVSLDLGSGSSPRSFDFDDQTKVDFDAPSLTESNNLIHQSLRRQEFLDHLKPTPPGDTPPAEPIPPGDSPPVEPTPSGDTPLA